MNAPESGESSRPLVIGIDFGDDETVSKPTVATIKPTDMPFLEVAPILLHSVPGNSRTIKTAVTYEMTLWTPGWSSKIGRAHV